MTPTPRLLFFLIVAFFAVWPITDFLARLSFPAAKGLWGVAHVAGCLAWAIAAELLFRRFVDRSHDSDDD